MISVMLVDDHAIVRSGLRHLLESRGIDVSGEAENGLDALNKYPNIMPDVVLMDISMPKMDGLEATRELIRKYPKAHILVLTMFQEEQYALRILKAGALGFINKSASELLFIEAISQVAKGQRYLSTDMANQIFWQMIDKDDDVSLNVLSDREMQVMVLLAKGGKVGEIAESLNLSPSTIETYRGRIMEKLQLNNISDLIKFAIKQKIISI